MLYAKTESPYEYTQHNDATYIVALNCRYEDRPFTHLTMRVNQRPRVHNYGRQNMLDELPSDIIYERDREREMTAGRFVSSSSRLEDFSKMTMTLARKPFIFPDHGDRINIRLDAITCEVLDSYDHYDDEEMLRLKWLDDRPGFQGYMQIRHYPLFGDVTDDLVLAIRVHRAADKFTRIPPIFIDTVAKNVVSAFPSASFPFPATFNARPPFRSGECRLLRGSDETGPRVTAKYVNMAGEMLWSLEIGTSRKINRVYTSQEEDTNGSGGSESEGSTLLETY